MENGREAGMGEEKRYKVGKVEGTGAVGHGELAEADEINK